MKRIILILGFFLVSKVLLSGITFSPNEGNWTLSIGESFSQIITVKGKEDMTLINASNNLPDGLSYSPNIGDSIGTDTGYVRISGTVQSTATNGWINFTVKDSDDPPSSATSGRYNFTIRVELITASLPDGQVGSYYSSSLNSRGGSGSYTYSLISGSLPPGLSLSPSGIINGTPTTPGTYYFIIQSADSSDSFNYDSRSYSITIDPQPIYSISDEGQICFVEDVVRNDSGIVISTGNLFVKILKTGVEKQITDFPPGAIINPELTMSGKYILFTYSPSPSTTNFSVYLANVNATLMDTSQGKLDFLPDKNIKYASLSPNFDEENQSFGYLVYTTEEIDRTNLYVFDFSAPVLEEGSTLIFSQKNFYIKNPVFISNNEIVFIGITNGIQNLYKINIDGTYSTQLTNNTSLTPQYGRISSSKRNPGIDSMIIYPKRIGEGYGKYGNWDIYIRPVDGNEINVTGTEEDDEVAPCFFGDNFTTPTLGENFGQMFYGISLKSENYAETDIWQANYDTLTEDTNTSRKTRKSNGNFSLPDWSPVPSISQGIPDYVNIEDTVFVFSDSAGGTDQIFSANYDGSNRVQLTITGQNKDEPDIARNGGTIVYTYHNPSIGSSYIYKMNHDGSGNVSFSSSGSTKANISPDGRWVVYVKQAGSNQFEVVAKNITGGSEIVLDDNGGNYYLDIDPPHFNPDMTKLVYSVKSPNGDWDIYTLDVSVDNIAKNITPGTLDKLTDTPTSYERYPSFSNDGKKIIFVSNMLDGVEQIFTMDINGSGIELIVSNDGSYSFYYPIYGPVYDEANNTDMIAFIRNNEICYGPVYRNSRENPNYSDDPYVKNPIGSITSTGITVVNYKFGWGVIREKGKIVGYRYLPEKAALNLPINYDVIIDVDEASIPNGFILNEIFPSNITINNIVVDGTSASYNEVDNSPSAGLKTISLLFGAGINGGVADHIVRFNVTPSIDGYKTITGEIKTLITEPEISLIKGNATFKVEYPYIPIDKYDKNRNSISGDGVIDDWDLLYTINCWAADAQLSGYGPKWPSDINNWDNILLAVIDIWASQNIAGWYAPTAGGANTQVGNPQTKAGEYTFVGDIDGDGLSEIYAPDGLTSGYPEMYWTQGEWVNP